MVQVINGCAVVENFLNVIAIHGVVEIYPILPLL